MVAPDDIDHGLRPGKPSAESAELRAARRRIRELETELAIIRHAAKLLGEDGQPQHEILTGEGDVDIGRGTRNSTMTANGNLFRHPDGHRYLRSADFGSAMRAAPYAGRVSVPLRGCREPIPAGTPTAVGACSA